MKKLIALMLICIICTGLCSCTFITDLTLNNRAVALADEAMDVNYSDYYKDEEYRSFLSKIEAFSARLTERLCAECGEDENTVISPISVYMALSLAIECTTGETRQEILDAVGVTYSEVNKYAKTLYGFGNIKYQQINAVGLPETVGCQELTNSIWLDDSVEFYEEGVNKLASEYNCDVFQSSFESGEAGKLINMYIEEKSRGLLNGDIDFSPETYFVLMNTYYLKDIWNNTGTHLEFTDEKTYFRNTDGSTVYTKLLQGYYNDGKAYDGNNFTSFFTDTDHGFKIYFFVPDGERSVSSIFTAENISAVLSLENWGSVDDENRQIHYTRVLFPEFEAEFSEDISGVLSDDFGIKKLFDPFECDPSTVSVKPVYCDGVVHKAALKVDKTGIKGAASTVMPVCGSAGPPPYEKVYHDLVVDKAFGFVLTDQYGTVLFSGVINSID